LFYDVLYVVLCLIMWYLVCAGFSQQGDCCSPDA
jgi:hypothetical protein